MFFIKIMIIITSLLGIAVIMSWWLRSNLIATWSVGAQIVGKRGKQLIRLLNFFFVHFRCFLIFNYLFQILISRTNVLQNFFVPSLIKELFHNDEHYWWDWYEDTDIIIGQFKNMCSQYFLCKNVPSTN